jgi:hypothetical protein
VAAGAAGIIATNTTIDYSLVPGAQGFGGISGRALKEKSFTVLQEVARAVYGKTILVSAGGIDSGAEAYRRLKAGASLVQIYTALIYEGPSLPRRINEELLALMKRDGVKGIAEVIGADCRYPPHHPGPLLPSPSPQPGEEGEKQESFNRSPLSPGRGEGDGREGVGGVRGLGGGKIGPE